MPDGSRRAGRRLALGALAAASLLAAWACAPIAPAGERTSAARDAVVQGAEHRVRNGDLELYVWEKHAGSPAGKPVVVLAHGSATAGRESFDLQVPGHPQVSLMDTLARAGFDVFALDVRGFGRSTRPPGHMTTAQAAGDLNAVVDHVRRLRGVERVSVLGWSWGTQFAGLFAADHPGKIDRYVSLAQMHVDSPDLIARRPRLQSFRDNPYVVVPEAGWKPRFASRTPASANRPEIVDAYAQAAARAETRTPTGPQLDLVTLMPMVDARRIQAPTLMIHGQYDDVADPAGLWPFFAALPNPDKRYVIVPDAGHMIMFQQGNRAFQKAVIDFLSP